MYAGLIKDETPETITLDVDTVRIDGSTRKMLLVCDKDTEWMRDGKRAYVDGHIRPSSQKDTFFLTVK